MDDHHFSYITKSKKKTLAKKGYLRTSVGRFSELGSKLARSSGGFSLWKPSRKTPRVGDLVFENCTLRPALH
jgi:hypothetical protein